MDNFDDLLPSQRALEDNPFANHFGGDRSSSPDPWASQFSRTQDDVYSSLPAVDVYATSFESPQEPLRIEAEDKISSVPTSPKVEKVAEPVINDPLELAAHAYDDDNESHPQTLPAGFRESRDSPPSSFNEIATIRPTEPEPFAATTTNLMASHSEFDNVHDHERHEQNARPLENQDDDDSDDDKPISQTLSKIQSEDASRAVCSLSFYL
jgi:hypothetical protein